MKFYFEFEFVNSEPTRLVKALKGAEPELWLAQRIGVILPSGSLLRLVQNDKKKSFELHLRDGRVAWRAEIAVIQPKDSAGQPNHRFTINGSSFSYYDPSLLTFLQTFPLN